MIRTRPLQLIAVLTAVAAMAGFASAGNAQAAFLGSILYPNDTIQSSNATLQVHCNTSWGNGQKYRSFQIDLYTYSVGWEFALEVQYVVYVNGRQVKHQPFIRVGRIGTLYKETNVPVSVSAAPQTVQVLQQFRVWTSRGWVYAPNGQWEIANHSTNAYSSGNTCTHY
jgi:hypothetical protein